MTPDPVDIAFGPNPNDPRKQIKPSESPYIYPRLAQPQRPDPRTVPPITLMAIDAVGTIVDPFYRDWRNLAGRFMAFPYKVNIDVERSFMALKDNYKIALLADMRAQHTLALHEKIMPTAFSYIIQCTSKDEYYLFCEAHRPQMLFSNLPQKFRCETLGAVPYDGAEGLLRVIETHTRI